MSVPTDNLYDFVHQVTEKQYWIIRSYPWGSKELADFGDYQSDLDGPNGIPMQHRMLHKVLPAVPQSLPYFKQVRNFQPVLFCHDQEPLNFDLYQDGSEIMGRFVESASYDCSFPHNDFNLRNVMVWSWQDKWILLHSELNSQELKRYENTGRYVGAYWWSHAMIALDWYRYAQYDASLTHVIPEKMFLIYARDCTGSRQYRGDFLKMIADFSHHCQIGSNDKHSVTANSSAVYNSVDLTNCAFSVVLETLFDDTRIHLTEKTLRPLACAQPFILAAGPGSLDLIKSYGFETFSPWINESYDNIADGHARLRAIVTEMKRLANLSPEQQCHIIEQCRAVAIRNQTRFFHYDFAKSIVNELKTNVDHAWKKNQGRLSPDFYWKTLRWRRQNNPEYFTPERRADQRLLLPLVRRLRKST